MFTCSLILNQDEKKEFTRLSNIQEVMKFKVIIILIMIVTLLLTISNSR